MTSEYRIMPSPVSSYPASSVRNVIGISATQGSTFACSCIRVATGPKTSTQGGSGLDFSRGSSKKIEQSGSS